MKKLGAPDISQSLVRLSNNGFNPQVIFDIGAYQGDFARLVLKLWPQSKVVCFEALEHKVAELTKLAEEEKSITVVPGLIGASNSDKVAFYEYETGSSVLNEHMDKEFPVKQYQMRTLESVSIDLLDGITPDLLKMDVQGYELEVLKGAELLVPKIKVILLEVNLLDIHKEVPLLDDIVIWMKNRGWVAYDICSLIRRPLDCALWQADMIFIPLNSSLRADKRWGKK